MSRTTLCVLTAAGLATASVGLMVGRYQLLGDEIKAPADPNTWKVTMLFEGKTASTDARLMTAMPLDFGRQHVFAEVCRSSELLSRPPAPRHPERHQILWSSRAGVVPGPFRARYTFRCTVNVHAPTSSMTSLSRALYAAPITGEQSVNEPRIETHHPDISALARRLTSGLEGTADQLDALYRHVDQQVANEPALPGPGLSAVQCLHNGAGDSAAKARLLVALCRNRGIPARMVYGLALKHGHEQSAHAWVEVWSHNSWVSACPFYHHLGRVPPSYLIFSYGDTPLVRGRNVHDLTAAFLVEHPAAEEEQAADTPALKHWLTRLSLYSLPPAEQRLVEFLLLLPLAALIVCIFRNIIGLNSFGTFAPALVGLAFREVGGLPGILVFIAIVLVGWLMRRVLDAYHLLQVPRKAFLLTLVVIILIAAIVTANFQDLPATKYISLFPMVILTSMIERFWTLEVEDGASSSFRTLLGTVVIAVSISLFLSLHAVVHHMFRFPETLGLILAVQLLLGRYTGYRLSELLRFRDLVKESA
jgi:hypothetical protein